MKLVIDEHDLRPLVKSVCAELQSQFTTDDRLAYSEAEAARLLSVPRHVLRDARLRGEISARRIGKSYRYSRAALLAFVEGGDANL